MKKEELKPFTKRVSICRVEDSKTGKTKQIKKTTKVYAKSKKEADEKFAEFKKKERDRILNIKEQRTLGDVIECFYKENTQYGINTVVKRKWYRKIIEEEFGDKLVYIIEGDDIKQFLRDLRDENGYSEETLRDFRRLLKDYFEYAEINRFINENPMNELKKFEIGKRINLRRNRNAIVPADTKRVVRYILNHKTERGFSLELKVQILLSLDGCLRPTELYALTWNDIDLDEGSMMIEKDITVISKKDAEELNVECITIGDTKTNGSVRKIPLSKRTIELLTEYKQDCEEFLKKKKCTNPEGILFFQRRNIKKGPVSYAYGSGLRARLRKISKYLLQGKGICPYSLRKLGVTERKNVGEIPPSVSDYIMGHNGNPLDLRYVSDYYPLAKKAMPAWEKVLDGILGTKTK
ncbi:MAG: tyrosine-type recombinase/integrase [Acidaminococcaceae bacterium]|nr:tyrosine-type recombinase/integrase [Acidaminococcaceae bacterium]